MEGIAQRYRKKQKCVNREELGGNFDLKREDSKGQVVTRNNLWAIHMDV